MTKAEFKKMVEKAKKKFEKLPTSQLLDMGLPSSDEESDALWGVLTDRNPFDYYEERKKWTENAIEELQKSVDALWKAMREHKHHEGRVVRDL